MDKPDELPSFSASATPGYSLWIQDVRISIHDCPECLDSGECDCEFCEYYLPESCPFLRDPHLRRDIKGLLDSRRERHRAYVEWQDNMFSAIATELKAHGRPLHYTVLAQMVQARYPELRATEWSIAKFMGSHPAIFERVAEGVYVYRGS